MREKDIFELEDNEVTLSIFSSSQPFKSNTEFVINGGCHKL